MIDGLMIDEEDRHFLSECRWYLSKTKEGILYVKAYSNGKWVYLHRLIMKAGSGQEVDHADGNRLNNRKSNLRFCTRSQNLFNKRISKSNTSGFKGVTWNKNAKRWMAQIAPKGKHVCLGYFDDPQKAHEAYRRAAVQFAGEFARC